MKFKDQYLDVWVEIDKRKIHVSQQTIKGWRKLYVNGEETLAQKVFNWPSLYEVFLILMMIGGSLLLFVNVAQELMKCI